MELGEEESREEGFKFITTAEAGAERDGFGGRKGVEGWNLCARSPLESCSNDLGAIRECLLKKKALDVGLLEFLERGPTPVPGGSGSAAPGTQQPVPAGSKTTPGAAKSKSFHATAEVPAATAKMRLVQIADEIVAALSSDPNATVRVVVEISAEFPDGAKDTVKRAVSENARSLGLKSADWE